MKPTIAILAVILLSAGGAAAQTAEAPPPVAQATAPEVPASGESWNLFSRTPDRVYLVDLGAVVTTGDVKAVKVAVVPQQADAGDLSHSIDIYELKCDAGQSRATTSTQYGVDGALVDQYDDPSPWEAVRTGSVDQNVSTLVCNDRVTTQIYPTIKAFIDAGRP